MVDRALALNVLQLVALSLPAFAILLQIIVESDFAYVNEAVPVIVTGFGAFLLAGFVILVSLLFSPLSLAMRAALVILSAGMLILIAGIALIGLRTRRAQKVASE